MPHIDKVIVTNVSQLRAKYGAKFRTVAAAAKHLMAADAKRGLTTRWVALDSTATMKRLKGHAVTVPSSQQQNKAAVDAVARALTPDYVLILGSVDVVPHQDLRNPVYSPGNDDDPYASGDLPYSCEQPYSRRVEDFRGPTRVVGRLPDLTGTGDAGYLSGLLKVAANYTGLTRKGFASYLGMSADAWKGSTEMSVSTVFGSSKDLQLVPPRGARWSPTLLERRSHFINCHGAPADTRFYGQRGDNYPVAHDAALIDGKLTPGTVVAAECCYGAELFDPKRARGQAGICNTYLKSKAWGFFGSSTIAYGPATGNGSADLICQYFLEAVLAGSSLGRAALEARQRFVRSASVLDPTDLKTLAQFSLMGDPSIHPVWTAHKGLSRTKAFRKAFPAAGVLPLGRSLRRDRLLRDGITLSRTVSAARRAGATRPTAKIRQVLTQAARESDLKSCSLTSFGVHHPAAALLKGPGAPPGRRSGATGVHMIIGSRRGVARGSGRRTEGRPTGASKVPRVVVVVATVRDGALERLRRLHSR